MGRTPVIASHARSPPSGASPYCSSESTLSTSDCTFCFSCSIDVFSSILDGTRDTAALIVEEDAERLTVLCGAVAMFVNRELSWSLDCGQVGEIPDRWLGPSRTRTEVTRICTQAQRSGCWRGADGESDKESLLIQTPALYSRRRKACFVPPRTACENTWPCEQII